jgi:hypothetical protein
MLVHGFAPASNLHLGYTLPSVRSSLRGVVRSRPIVAKRRAQLLPGDWMEINLAASGPPIKPNCGGEGA